MPEDHSRTGKTEKQLKKTIAAGLLATAALLGAGAAGMGMANAIPTCPVHSHYDVQIQGCMQDDEYGYHGTVVGGPEIDRWSFKKGDGMAQLALEMRRRGPSSSDVRDATPGDACDMAIMTVALERRDPEITRYSDNFDWLSAKLGCMSRLRQTGHIS